MSILSKFLGKIKSHQRDIFLVICIGLISFISYNLGKINVLQKTPIKIERSADYKTQNNSLKANIFRASSNKLEANSQKQAAKSLDTRVVVSKKSASKKYHFSWCPSAKKIKEENKIWFGTEEEAQKAGYTLAGNCNK